MVNLATKKIVAVLAVFLVGSLVTTRVEAQRVASGLVVGYDFSEGSGTTVGDSSEWRSAGPSDPRSVGRHMGCRIYHLRCLDDYLFRLGGECRSRIYRWENLDRDHR